MLSALLLGRKEVEETGGEKIAPWGRGVRYSGLAVIGGQPLAGFFKGPLCRDGYAARERAWACAHIGQI